MTIPQLLDFWVSFSEIRFSIPGVAFSSSVGPAEGLKANEISIQFLSRGIFYVLLWSILEKCGFDFVSAFIAEAQLVAQGKEELTSGLVVSERVGLAPVPSPGQVASGEDSRHLEREEMPEKLLVQAEKWAAWNGAWARLSSHLCKIAL